MTTTQPRQSKANNNDDMQHMVKQQGLKVHLLLSR